MFVQLIDHRLVVVPLVPWNFIHADRFDVLQATMLQSPRNCVFHGLIDVVPIDVVPAHAESFRNFLPGPASRPASQEPLILGRQEALAFRPRDLLYFDPATNAWNAPHLVHEVDIIPPSGMNSKRRGSGNVS